MNRIAIDVISKKSFSVAQECRSVLAVARHLAMSGESAILVVDDEGKLSGICTERDIVKAVSSGQPLDALNVSSIMSHKPITGAPERTVGELLLIMQMNDFRHLPVVSPDNRPLGIISVKDALSYEFYSAKKSAEHTALVFEAIA